jgi:hypothetical protein
MLNNLLKEVKKGESLIEVIVALSIITIALSSVVQLIIYSSNLNLSSRGRTSAIAEIQKTKSDFISKNILRKCGSVTPSELKGLATKEELVDKCNKGKNLEAGGSVCTYIKVYQLSAEKIEYKSYGMDKEKFVKITSFGKWKDKNDEVQEFSISEIVGL